MKAACCLLLASLGLVFQSAAGEPKQPEQLPFTVMVYNVENLFDVDGVARFEDYRANNSRNPSPYSPGKLLTKLENIARVVSHVNQGHGPDLILFQEFERDLSPGPSPFDYASFLNEYASANIQNILTTDFSETIADLPAEALLLKYFEDHGLTGYEVAVAKDSEDPEVAKAHNNVIFSRFPILHEESLPAKKARPIQIVTVDVEGNPLTVINNHWKSGASNPSLEDDRLPNPRQVRRWVEARLQREPYADIIVAGDLNTLYNAVEFFPTQNWRRRSFAIRELGSQGDELAIREHGGPPFYNLWFELPEQERGSDLYRGQWTTLMQMLLTRGLYDQAGIAYVDGSFRRVIIPGETTRGPWQEPREWSFAGEGDGYSDHFPIAADFKVAAPDGAGVFSELKAPSRSAQAPATVPRIDFVAESKRRHPDFTETVDNPAKDALAPYYGKLYEVHATVVSTHPPTVQIGQKFFEVYAYGRSLRRKLDALKPGQPIAFLGQLDEHRGRVQFIIHHPSWLRSKN